MQNQLNDIIRQVKSGNKAAFRFLVEAHQQYAFNLAFRVVCDESDARDVVQDSFIKIWKNIGQFNEELKFTTWMYKIVMNSAIDKLRTSKRPERAKPEEILVTLSSIEQNGIENHYENRQLAEVIARISDGLPEKQRQVFVLRDLQGLDSEEVEKILDMDETSVKSNLYHARQIVRKTLEQIFAFERREK